MVNRPLWLEPERNRAKAHERAAHQPGADQEHQRERELSGGQQPANRRRTAR